MCVYCVSVCVCLYVCNVFVCVGSKCVCLIKPVVSHFCNSRKVVKQLICFCINFFKGFFKLLYSIKENACYSNPLSNTTLTIPLLNR